MDGWYPGGVWYKAEHLKVLVRESDDIKHFSVYMEHRSCVASTIPGMPFPFLGVANIFLGFSKKKKTPS